jgi:hypothetical protein
MGPPCPEPLVRQVPLWETLQLFGEERRGLRPPNHPLSMYLGLWFGMPPC